MTDPWPLRSSLELGAELLVSELIASAVNATGQPGQTVTVNLAGNATSVLIEVRDADPRPPRTKGTNDDGASAGTGGVLLVAALSTRWNWYLTEEPPGKVVWCELVTGQSGPPTQPPPTQPPPTQPQKTQPQKTPSPRRPSSRPCPAGYRAPARSRRPRSSPTSTSCAASATTC